MAFSDQHPREQGTDSDPSATPPDDSAGLFSGFAEPDKRSNPTREPTVNELMNGPKRPDDQLRKTVLWMVLAFMSLLMVLTVSVMAINGVELLSLASIVVLGVIIYVLIGLIRYEGVDPMARFDPPSADEHSEPGEERNTRF